MTGRGVRVIAAIAAAVAHALARAQSDATAYQDALIDGGALAPIVDAPSNDAPYDPSGWPRALRLDAVQSRFFQNGRVTDENGVALSGRLDTPTMGALSLDATVRTQPANAIATLWQRALPFDDGWRADNAVGALNTLGIDLARKQSRFYLPTFVVTGAATEWRHDGDLQWQASGGRPGLFNGVRLAGFQSLSGDVATAGVQWRVAPHWDAALQVVDAHDVRTALDPLDPAADINARSWFAASAWERADTRWQVNLLDSDVRGDTHRTGLWIDGTTRDGRLGHTFGAFRLDPKLMWGYLPIASDLRGGYYRANYQSRRWTVDGGIDRVESVSGNGVAGWFTTGSARYQVDRALGFGGGVNDRQTRGAGNAWSAFGFVDANGAWGTSRVQLDTAHDAQAHRADQVGLDQTWPVPVGTRLSTSTSYGVERGSGTGPGGDRLRRASVAVLGGGDLSHGLSIDANVRVSRSRGALDTTGRYANVAITWRVSPDVSVIANYYENRDDDRTFLQVASLIPTFSVVSQTLRDRALFLTVRIETRAGSAAVPLGGLAGRGAGTITGTIYLDANDNGVRDANEPGAANVTVLLDGRYSTRTDANGRYEFPFVAAGTHTVVVVPDNLPLPWIVSDEGRREVVVRTRASTTLDIAASRMK